MSADPYIHDIAASDADSIAQMMEAPREAFYVIHHARATGYFCAMAEDIGRDDLLFIALSAFDRVGPWLAREPRHFVVDHYAKTIMTPAQRETLKVLDLRAPK